MTHKAINEKVSIIIPAYNCATTILGDLQALHARLKYIALNRDFEIIVVDDGSDDDTYDRINEEAQEWGLCDYALELTENSGKGAALKEGFRYARGEYIVFMDADAQIDCEDLSCFFRIMDLYRAGAVIGNKRHLYSDVSYSPIRWVVSNTYNAICNFLFGIKLRDTQCGFKLFKREALAKVMPRLLVKRYAFDLELIVALKDNGIRVADAPVIVHEQQNSGSVNLNNIYMTALDTLAVWYRRKKGWYKK